MSFTRKSPMYMILRCNIPSRAISRLPVRQSLFVPSLHTPKQLGRQFATCSSPHSSEIGKSCWRCKEDLRSSEVFCHNTTCGTIQPIPTSVTFFEVLVGQEMFDVNIAQLKKKYLSLQQQLHPDSYTRKPQKEFECAQVQSAWLNKAYHTLRDPLHRAQYLLELRGIQVDESESLDDPELLMEVLEVREELEDAQTDAEVEDIKLANDVKLKESIQELSLAFKRNDMERAKLLSIQLQYWVNIKKATQEWSPNKQVYISH
ncbi:molecular chaperone [Basidiobolus ranarum]|uniref:Molecular chaperone n=1 Tax=Basidiobolus ranarum TaxID=34480 RepID=A0ABR2VMZ5_9FUNG